MILAGHESTHHPVYTGLAEALVEPDTDVRIFGKPLSRVYRRMGVALAYGAPDADINSLRARAQRAASAVNVGG